MIDIFSIPLYYISADVKPELERNLRGKGFCNVNYFRAIDGKKFEPKNLLKQDVITIRAYNDLIDGREQHSGIPTTGAIGCTMSHYKLWKLCIDMNLPYIIIVEDDLIVDDITLDDIEKIDAILSTPKSAFISSKIHTKKQVEFVGIQFYIATNAACREMVANAFPIDVQTDWYIAHLHNIKKINIDGYPIMRQSWHTSSIQDMCIKCFAPKNSWVYISLIICVVFIILFMTVKLYNCNATNDKHVIYPNSVKLETKTF